MKLDLNILFLTVFIFLELNSVVSNISFLMFRCLLNPYLENPGPMTGILTASSNASYPGSLPHDVITAS